MLYHYTTAQGLAGIIPPNSWNVGHPDVDTRLEGAAQLQASDVRFMNDSQELQFGASVFERRFRATATDRAIPKTCGRCFTALQIPLAILIFSAAWAI
jgi:hypothetical protein